MIKTVSIKNFKTLKDVSFDLKSLNLFTGLNGTGKSSFIQSLLLLRQSFFDTTTVKGYLRLNGSLVNIGTGKDALYQFAENENLEFKVQFKDFSYTWGVSSNSDEDYLTPLERKKDLEDIYQNLENNSLFNDEFQYLNAEHIGPQLEYATSQWAIKKNQLGLKGEYAVHYLYSVGNRKEILFDNLHHSNSKTRKLIQEVNAWLGEISPNIKINTTPIPNSDRLILGFQYATKDDVTASFKPPIVGFGIGYVLPVIVALLSAEKGKLIILENPEAHLHPKGQSRIGRLMALAAKNGVQILVETHSDHVLNGIRVAVKKEDISPDEVGVFYFDRKVEEREHQATIHSLKIDKNGRIDKWPEGFFDEWDNMLNELIM